MRCNLTSEDEIKNQINSKKEEISKIEEEFKGRSSSIKRNTEIKALQKTLTDLKKASST